MNTEYTKMRNRSNFVTTKKNSDDDELLDITAGDVPMEQIEWLLPFRDDATNRFIGVPTGEFISMGWEVVLPPVKK